jgi:hypothetical protein
VDSTALNAQMLRQAHIRRVQSMKWQRIKGYGGRAGWRPVAGTPSRDEVRPPVPMASIAIIPTHRLVRQQMSLVNH